MAIDTENKRRSAYNSILPSIISVLPVPDGTIEMKDLPHVLGIYSGITILSSAIFDTVTFILYVDQQRDVTGHINQQEDLIGHIDQQRDFTLEF